MIDLKPFLGYEVEIWAGDRGRKGILHRFVTGVYGVPGFIAERSLSSITVNIERGQVIDPDLVDFHAEYEKTGLFLGGMETT